MLMLASFCHIPLQNVETDMKPKKIIGYGRASTIRQEISCEMQQQAVEDHVQRRMQDEWSGYEYAGFVRDEGVSGSVPLFERPGGSKLLRSLNRGDLIVVSNNDRAFRSVADLCHTLSILEDGKIDICILDLQVDSTTNSGRVMLQIMASLKEFERREIQRRNRETKAHCYRNKKACGRYSPIGWKTASKAKQADLIPCKETRAIGKYVVTLKDEHGFGFVDIGKIFMEKGVCWPSSHRNKGRIIRSTCTLSRLYRACKLGWPCCTDDELNATWRQTYASHEPAPLRLARSSSPSSPFQQAKDLLSTSSLLDP